MQPRTVAWPDPRSHAPAAFARLRWGATAEACGVGPVGDDLTWLSWRALPESMCFGARVAEIELGFVLGELEAANLRLEAAPGELAALGLSQVDEAMWLRETDTTRVEVDALERRIMLSEIT